MVRTYFAVINFLCVLVVSCWAFHTGKMYGFSSGLLLASGVLAFGGSCTATEVGQVGIFVTAALVGVLWLDEANQGIGQGLLWGLAMIKPTISGPFFLCLLLKKRFLAVAVACLFVLIGSAVSWLMTETNPFEMLMQMVISAGSYADHGSIGPVWLLLELGIQAEYVNGLSSLLVFTIGTVIMSFLRHRSLLDLFAIAAIVGRFWTYHKGYDDVMLVFVLVALGQRALARQTVVRWLAFFIFGMSVWVPARVSAVPEFQIFLLVGWGGSGAMILFRRPKLGASAEQKSALGNPTPGPSTVSESPRTSNSSGL